MRTVSIQEVEKAVFGKITVKGEAKDAEISFVSTDSRDAGEGTLFVPIVGENVDAHKFIPDVLKKGAFAVLTSEGTFKEDGIYIEVSDTKKAMQDLASFYRDGFSVPVIGVTGSVGKTTTKEMLYTALASSGKRVLKTEGNMNSQIGLPLMMFRIEEETELAVIEMGMSEKGEMENLSRIAKPCVAVMTNIGVSHIGNLGSQENIRKEKLSIINDFPETGVLFVNGDDKLLYEVKELKEKLLTGRGEEVKELLYPRTMEQLKKITVVTYGMGTHCDFRAVDVDTDGMGGSFVFQSKKNKEQVKLSVPGVHNILNATAALALAEYFDMDVQKAGKALSLYQPIAMRGGFIEKGGLTIIDDTYNASPDSMKSGIDVLLSAKTEGRRFAVLADVLELGEASHACHYGVGEFIASRNRDGNRVDVLVTFGKEARAICEGAEETMAKLQENGTISCHAFLDKKEVIAFLKKEAAAGDILLVKGSRGMHMDEIVKEL